MQKINANQIVSSIAHINRFWSEEYMREMWYKHLALTNSEAVAIFAGNYIRGLSIFEQIEEEVLMMADDFAEGM